MRISDWSSDVCSSDLEGRDREAFVAEGRASACAKVRRIEDRASEVGDRKAGQQLLPTVEPGRIARDGQRPPAAPRRAVAKREVGHLITLRCDLAVATVV